MNKPFPRSAVGAAVAPRAVCAAIVSLCSLGSALQAQAQTPAPTLKEVVVTDNPLDATDLIAPAAQYSGAVLLLRSKTTLSRSTP